MRGLEEEDGAERGLQRAHHDREVSEHRDVHRAHHVDHDWEVGEGKHLFVPRLHTLRAVSQWVDLKCEKCERFSMYHRDFLCYDKTCKDRIWVESFHDSVKYEGKKSLVETEKDPEKREKDPAAA